MARRTSISVACISLLAAVAQAAVIYVDVANNSGYEDGSQYAPYNTIQEGLNAAGNGCTVQVAPGEYVERISMPSGLTSLLLTSELPWEYSCVAETIVNADTDSNPSSANGPALTLLSGHGPGVTIRGLTITGGYYSSGGGGVVGNYSQAVIENCIIRGNRAGGGGGLNLFNGYLRCSIVCGNEALAADGGGLRLCDCDVTDTIICHNRAAYSGGGMYDCDGDIVNCLIVDNCAIYNGGGIRQCNGNCYNCTFANNRGTNGGAISDCSFGYMSVNNIVWGNQSYLSNHVNNTTNLQYSCIEDWTGGGIGNFAANPLFVGTSMGYYCLSSTTAGQPATSPCIDGGTPGALTYGTTTLDGAEDANHDDMGFHYPVPDPKTYSLPSGWSLIGWQEDEPYSPLRISNAKVIWGPSTYTWDQAVTMGLVQGQVYYYVTGSGYGVLASSGGNDDRFRSGRGYWILNQSGSSLILETPTQTVFGQCWVGSGIK